MSSSNDILRRKMRPKPMALGAAATWWNENFDRVLRELFKNNFHLDVELKTPEARVEHSRDALQSMGKVMLPFMLQGTGQQRGLFVLDGPLIDALIELQMLDMVLPTPRLDRPITKIDEGLSEGFVHLCLNAMQNAPGLMSSLSVVEAQQDRAALRLALGDSRYDILAAEIDLGPGIKTGLFELWLPISEPAKTHPSKQNPEMIKILAECEIDVTASFVDCKVSAHELLEIAPGTAIRIPASAINDVQVCDCDGRRIATAKLGQLNGHRAIRIRELANEIPDDAIAPPASADTSPNSLPAPMVEAKPKTAVDMSGSQTSGVEKPSQDGDFQAGRSEPGSTDPSDTGVDFDPMPIG